MGRTAVLLLLCAVTLLLLQDGVSGRHHHSRHHHSRHHHYRSRRVRVRTACQGARLSLGCHRGYHVHVLAAFYGRTSRRICPAGGPRHSHKVGPVLHARCAAKGSLGRVRRLCENRRHCRVRANNRVFGNPCRHTRKYLRLLYTCKFSRCLMVKRLQVRLILLVKRYEKLAKVSHGYWRRRHFMRRRHHLMRKLNHLRWRYRLCFKCRRGCAHLRRRSENLKRAQTRIQKLLKELAAKRKTHHHRLRWHAGRWFLGRKLAYLRARQRMLRPRLRRCMRSCHY